MEIEKELAEALAVEPPTAYDRTDPGRRAWWRRALRLYRTYCVKHPDRAPLDRTDLLWYRYTSDPPITRIQNQLTSNVWKWGRQANSDRVHVEKLYPAPKMDEHWDDATKESVTAEYNRQLRLGLPHPDRENGGRKEPLAPPDLFLAHDEDADDPPDSGMSFYSLGSEQRPDHLKLFQERPVKPWSRWREYVDASMAFLPRWNRGMKVLKACRGWDLKTKKLAILDRWAAKRREAKSPKLAA